jgi:hypothetical protein
MWVLFFICGLDLSPSCELAGVGVSFIFYPWVYEISNFDGFDSVRPSKLSSVSKF